MHTTLRGSAEELSVSIPAGSVQLEGILMMPDEAEDIVLFAHGGGSGLYSTRNRYIAHVLRQNGLATLLISLMTSEEEAIDVRTQQFRLDVSLLTARLLSTTAWLSHQPSTCHLKIGYLGDGIAGGAALLAAAEHPFALGAIALRSGRTDLADHLLPQIQVPTLLIVDSSDPETVAMNQQKLEIISGASHQFAEPGALAEVARLASQWFKHYLTSAAPSPYHHPADPVCSDRSSYG
jgi:putative phosphoribosyl transferase